jgi:carbamoylphosphate synthase large subunit
MGLLHDRRRVAFTRKRDWELILRQSVDHSRYAIRFVDPEQRADLKDAVLIPLTIEGALSAARLAVSAVCPDMLSVSPTAEIIRFCDDKPAFNACLRERGFAALLPADASLSAPSRFPLIVKPRRGEWGMHIIILRHAEEVRRHLAMRDASADEFAQEYVTGLCEYTTHFLRRRGRLVFSKTMEFTFADEFYVKGLTHSFLSCRTVPERHLATLEGVLNAIGYEGVGCFNYKVAADRPVIFELNPRFGSSLCPHVTEFLDACCGR